MWILINASEYWAGIRGVIWKFLWTQTLWLCSWENQITQSQTDTLGELYLCQNPNMKTVQHRVEDLQDLWLIRLSLTFWLALDWKLLFHGISLFLEQRAALLSPGNSSCHLAPNSLYKQVTNTHLVIGSIRILFSEQFPTLCAVTLTSARRGRCVTTPGIKVWMTKLSPIKKTSDFVRHLLLRIL